MLKANIQLVMISMFVITASGQLRQEDCHKFRASIENMVNFSSALGYLVRSFLNQSINQAVLYLDILLFLSDLVCLLNINYLCWDLRHKIVGKV